MTIFPAYAGVSLVDKTLTAHGVDIPRVCGGEPNNYSKWRPAILYSPRMRG